METGNFGPVLALVGLVLVLATGWGRRRARVQKQSSSPAALRYHYWGGLLGFLLILAGLVLMNYQR